MCQKQQATKTKKQILPEAKSWKHNSTLIKVYLHAFVYLLSKQSPIESN